MKRKRSVSQNHQIDAGLFTALITLAVGFSLRWLTPAEKTSGYEYILLIILFAVVNIALLLNLDLIKRIPNIEHLIKENRKSIKHHEDILNDVNKYNEHLQSIYRHFYSNINWISSRIGHKIIGRYLEGFRLTKYGFSLRGESFALLSYIEFWNHILDIQSSPNMDNDDDRIIVRITHSNNIDLWYHGDSYDEHLRMSTRLYDLQDKFIKCGGRIYRIFIGNIDDLCNSSDQEMVTEEKIRNETLKKKYLWVLNKMESIGISVRYLSKREAGERIYDYIFLHDQDVSVRWISGASGDKLVRCQIDNAIDAEIRDDWATLWYTLANQHFDDNSDASNRYKQPFDPLPEGRDFQ